MNIRSIFLLLSFLLSIFVACSSDKMTTVDSGEPDLPFTADFKVADSYINPCAPNPAPSVSGKVYAPNGNDPVAGATIGVALSIASLPPQVQCQSCNNTGHFSAQTYSLADGSFKLSGVPLGQSFKLVIQKGYFRRVLDIQMDECGNLELNHEQTRLPGKQAHYSPDDTIPRIAVITGVWDQLEKVLDKLGVEEKDIYHGRDITSGKESAQELLLNGGLLKSYHIVLINCGVVVEELVYYNQNNPSIARMNLREYARLGGRLFVTDYSYDFVEQPFPEFIDFQGSHDGEPLSTIETPDSAQTGTADLVVEGNVKDNELKEWLDSVGALLPNGLVQIVGFEEYWAVQKEVNSNAKVWVDGYVTGIGVTKDEPRPLTTSWEFRDDDNQGCGRIVFSSYHTHGEGENLLPQERVLEYLFLEIGECTIVK